MQEKSIGRFDQSFLIHMIKDFFLVLILVTVLEFAMKAGKVYWDYQSNGETQALNVAEELVDNVQSIMSNSGGPVAASTLYPILEKNWKELGYEIAITPSPATSIAIEKNFGFSPQGIPYASMAEGRNQSASIDVKATAFCTSCHSSAAVGDVLGTVTVRNYLDRDFEIWWEDVKLTLGLAVGKIVLHSILLFLILRARMEPLLRLRSVVSQLSKAYTNLGQRAEVRTSDEFGVLARDLNVFLDRIEQLLEELGSVLNKVVSVNDDILQVQADLREQIDKVVSSSRALERDAMLSAKREPRLSHAWFNTAKRSVSELGNALSEVDVAPQAEQILEDLRAVVNNAEEQIANSEHVYLGLAELGDQAETLKRPMAEMMRLEERMQSIIEIGTVLVRRLRPQSGVSES